MGGFSITRQIGIDVGHRVPTHGSKCWNWHGHRYTINATCKSSELHREGFQTDMVLDFGFLKHVMMEYCDDLCDHGTVVWVDDPLLHVMIPAKQYRDMVIHTVKREPMIYCLVNENRDRNQTKVLVVPFIPTAERLAEFWFKLMVDRVHELSQGLAELSEVEVFETPNCSARYPQ